jgi:hypothetical protein
MAGVPLPSAARGIFGAAKKATQISVPPAEDPPVEVQAPPEPPPVDVDTGDPPSGEPATVTGASEPVTPIAGVTPPPPPPEEPPVEIDLAEPEPPPEPNNPLAAIEAKKRGAIEAADRLANLRAERQSYLESRGATKAGETGSYRGPALGPPGLDRARPSRARGGGFEIPYERAEDDEGSSYFLPGGKSAEEIEAGLRNIKQKEEPVVAKIGALDDEIRRIESNVEALAGVLQSSGGFGRRLDSTSAMQGLTRFDLDTPSGVGRLVDETQGDFYQSGKPGRFFTIEDMATPEQKIMFETYAEEKAMLDGRKVNVITRDRLSEVMQDHNKLNRMLAEKVARRGMFERRRADLNAAHTNLRGMLRKSAPKSDEPQP